VEDGSQLLQIIVVRLAPAQNLQYAEYVVGGVFPPHPLLVAPVAVQILVMEGRLMTRKSTLASLVVAVVLSLFLTACKDTKTLQENEQLKAQVADLQKQNGQMGNNLETVTAARDALTQENEALKAQIRALKSKSPKKTASSRKRRRR
jgi:cell division protein FtsB